jgi:hypothetical protein
VPGLTTRDSYAGVRGLLLGQPRAWPVIPFCTTKSESVISETGLDATGVSLPVRTLEKGLHGTVPLDLKGTQAAQVVCDC